MSAFSAGNPFADDPPERAPGTAPVTPYAAPVLDAQGRLTYVGCDGLRYVVAEPPEANASR